MKVQYLATDYFARHKETVRRRLLLFPYLPVLHLPNLLADSAVDSLDVKRVDIHVADNQLSDPLHPFCAQEPVDEICFLSTPLFESHDVTFKEQQIDLICCVDICMDIISEEVNPSLLYDKIMIPPPMGLFKHITNTTECLFGDVNDMQELEQSLLDKDVPFLDGRSSVQRLPTPKMDDRRDSSLNEWFKPFDISASELPAIHQPSEMEEMNNPFEKMAETSWKDINEHNLSFQHLFIEEKIPHVMNETWAILHSEDFIEEGLFISSLLSAIDNTLHSQRKERDQLNTFYAMIGSLPSIEEFNRIGMKHNETKRGKIIPQKRPLDTVDPAPRKMQRPVSRAEVAHKPPPPSEKRMVQSTLPRVPSAEKTMKPATSRVNAFISKPPMKSSMASMIPTVPVTRVEPVRPQTPLATASQETSATASQKQLPRLRKLKRTEIADNVSDYLKLTGREDLLNQTAKQNIISAPLPKKRIQEKFTALQVENKSRNNSMILMDAKHIQSCLDAHIYEVASTRNRITWIYSERSDVYLHFQEMIFCIDRQEDLDVMGDCIQIIRADTHRRGKLVIIVLYSKPILDRNFFLRFIQSSSISQESRRPMSGHVTVRLTDTMEAIIGNIDDVIRDATQNLMRRQLTEKNHIHHLSHIEKMYNENKDDIDVITMYWLHRIKHHIENDSLSLAHQTIIDATSIHPSLLARCRSIRDALHIRAKNIDAGTEYDHPKMREIDRLLSDPSLFRDDRDARVIVHCTEEQVQERLKDLISNKDIECNIVYVPPPPADPIHHIVDGSFKRGVLIYNCDPRLLLRHIVWSHVTTLVEYSPSQVDYSSLRGVTDVITMDTAISGKEDAGVNMDLWVSLFRTTMGGGHVIDVKSVEGVEKWPKYVVPVAAGKSDLERDTLKRERLVVDTRENRAGCILYNETFPHLQLFLRRYPSRMIKRSMVYGEDLVVDENTCIVIEDVTRDKTEGLMQRLMTLSNTCRYSILFCLFTVTSLYREMKVLMGSLSHLNAKLYVRYCYAPEDIVTFVDEALENSRGMDVSEEPTAAEIFLSNFPMVNHYLAVRLLSKLRVSQLLSLSKEEMSVTLPPSVWEGFYALVRLQERK
ncbi:hypothetical protein PROFUN_09996 [Planoprotostelium fungivorum]|uniref:Uncharacterized protein n=1 Tax=Planoprotostelium fungivorum TaxID=1890364 RepID=A0A2P6NFT0_9EUKA|nr:hypothetical protein PROFUN_09996 [Planoprotostelium fungivorum]